MIIISDKMWKKIIFLVNDFFIPLYDNHKYFCTKSDKPKTKPVSSNINFIIQLRFAIKLHRKKLDELLCFKLIIVPWPGVPQSVIQEVTSHVTNYYVFYYNPYIIWNFKRDQGFNSHLGQFFISNYMCTSNPELLQSLRKWLISFISSNFEVIRNLLFSYKFTSL